MVVLKDEDGFYFSEFKHFITLGLANMRASMVKPWTQEPCQIAVFHNATDTDQTMKILAEKGIVVTPMNLCTVELGVQIDEMMSQIKMYEDLRPHWAKGYSSDSVAAQCTTAALTELWNLLGAKNQTEAASKLRELVAP